MPRVHRKTRSNRGFKTYTCRACGEVIEPGQEYYTWEKRYGGPQYQHTKCGYPRPSVLSNRKTAVIEDAIQDFPQSVEDLDEIRDVLQGIAETAREVGDEYEASADNMPESLQYGYQAEAMREVAQELRDWADNLESWDETFPEPTEDDLVGLAGVDFDDPESVETALEEAKTDWLDQQLSDANDQLSEMPEYQG